MSAMFFYGTLCHLPLLRLVLGRENVDQVPAQLADHRVVWAAGESFPLIEAAPGAVASGLLIRGLGPEDRARLRFYEGGFDYDLETRSVIPENGPPEEAELFFPAPGAWTPGGPWLLEDWVARWGALTLRAAEEVMGYYGRFTAAEVGARFPAIRRRAQAWVLARERPADPAFDPDRDVAVARLETPFAGFHIAQEVRLRHRRFDGAMGPEITRAAFMVGAAAVVLPYDPVRDAVLLVQQFRAPVFLAGDRAPWLWEPVAGLIDPGESPETAARREAREEAGIEIDRLEPAGGAYSSSGSMGEYVHCFVGLADFAARGQGGGLASENEDIRVRELPWAAFIEAVDAGEQKDLPLLFLANWLARHRERLRAG